VLQEWSSWVDTSERWFCLCAAGVELVGRHKRQMSAIVLNYFYAVGVAAVGLVAWLTMSWVAIQLIVSAPPAIFLLYYW
jgi:hypothetical protein